MDLLDAVWRWFADPMQYDFMRRAVIVSAVIGLVCAVLSCYVTLKGWSLLGDALSHAVLPGVVVSYVVGIPFVIGAFVASILSVSAIGFISGRTRLKSDTVIGIVFTGFFALGLILVTKVVSTVHFTHILLGSILGITTGNMLQTIAIATVTLILSVLVFRRDLVLFAFDPMHARSIGINPSFLSALLLTLLALTVVSAFQTVGVILVVAMLITPGATAYLLTDRFDRMMVIASIASVLSCVAGTFLSYHLNISTGGSIVATLTLVFVVTMVLAPRHGLLANQRRSRRSLAQLTDETMPDGTGRVLPRGAAALTTLLARTALRR